MPRSRIAWLAVVAALAAGPALLAQTGDQTTAPQDPSATSSPETQNDQNQNVTQLFTGCLMTESAYRSAHSLGGGAMGGVGLGDEFVLVDARTSAAAASATAMKQSEMKAIAENATPSVSPCPDKGKAYRLHGSAEDKMKNLVGHWLEITGKWTHADDIMADGTQKGTKLPAEVTILSAREMPAPAPRPAPAASESRPVTPPPPSPEPKVSNPVPPTTTSPEPMPSKELPHTAGSDAMIGLSGILAFGAGLSVMLLRRRSTS